MKKDTIITKKIIDRYDIYDIIMDISHLLSFLDEQNLCDDFKKKFNLKRILTFRIKTIILSKEGVIYLYNYFSKLIDEEVLLNLKKKRLLDAYSYKVVIKKIYPYFKEKYTKIKAK